MANAKLKSEVTGVQDLEVQSKYRIHVGIDFGTDGSTLAFALNTGEVFIHSRWKLQPKYQKLFKQKTKILIDETGETVAFGQAAHDMYVNNIDKNNGWKLFEYFKMKLYEEQMFKQNNVEQKEFHLNEQLTAANGARMSSKDVFIAALKYLQGLGTKYITEVLKLHDIQPSDIQYLLSVPAIWDDKAKDRMRQWAKAAKLCDKLTSDQLRIVYEPDCASLSVLEEIRQLKMADPPGVGDRYMLIDAGGGTVDIACHEMLDTLHVREILPCSGGPWGSIYIDHNFEALLSELFTKNWMENYKQGNPQGWLQFMENFQMAKESFLKDNDNNPTHNVRIDQSFLQFLSEKISQSEYKDMDEDEAITTIMETNVKRSKNKDVNKMTGKIQRQDDYLNIDVDLWKSFLFDPIVNKITNHIQTILQTTILGSLCSFVVMVGGFSESKYLESKIQALFPDVAIYKPKRPILAVVDGAARFGLSDNYEKYVSQRVLNRSYGYRICYTLPDAMEAKIPFTHINQNKFPSPYNKQEMLVDKIFESFIKQGDPIDFDSEPIIHKIQRVHETATTGDLEIYSAESRDQKIIDENCMLIGKVKGVTFPKEIKDLQVTLEFDFRYTVIHVYAYPSDHEHLKKEVKIQYQSDFNNN